MKKILTIFAIFAALLCGAGSAFSAEYVEGEVLVVLDISQLTMSVAISNGAVFAKSLSMQANNFASSVKATAVGIYPEIARSVGKNIIHLRSSSKTTEQLMNELKNDPRVKSVSPNGYRTANALVPPRKTPDDLKYDELWGIEKIGANKVWNNFTGDGKVVVAVLDTAIWAEHPDLKANMVTDSFGNHGRRFYDAGKVSVEFDPNIIFPNVASTDCCFIPIVTHGTHVAGIIGAVGNNQIGITGVSWNVGMLAVSVFTEIIDDEGKLDFEEFDSDVIGAINYILDEKNKGMNIRVVNMSFGGWGQNSGAYALAIESLCNNNIVVVFAAGNSDQDINASTRKKSSELFYPAAFRYSSTICVGATTNDDRRSLYSNYSNVWVDIAAPGGEYRKGVSTNMIMSTVIHRYVESGYGHLFGTSMAAPYVAGAAALLCMAYPDETAVQIKERILNNADKVGVVEGYWAKGRLNLKAAYDAIPAGAK